MAQESEELAQESEEIGGTEQALATLLFQNTYTGSSSISTSCDNTRPLWGYQPADPGTYPVFVFVTGTGMPYDAGVADNIVRYMAAQGFVAASVNYDNGTYPTACERLQTKAKCIYDTRMATPRSAVSVICGMQKAACATKGIYVAGFSQGAQISSMAANFGDSMRAAYLMGNGDDSAFANDSLRTCLDKNNLSFSSSQLREVSGERDQFFGVSFSGPSQAGAQAQLQRVTGVACPQGTYSCLQPDGSGWYIVKDSQIMLNDRYADHCYFYFGRRDFFGRPINTDCTNRNPTYDSGWDTGMDPWQKIPSLAWLKSK